MMNDFVSRRSVLKAGLGMMAGAPVLSACASSLAAEATRDAARGGAKFSIGIASYTFRSFDLSQVIRWTQELSVRFLCLKDVHLSLKASDEECERASAACAEAGIKLVGCGTVTFGSEADIDNAFRYARAAKMQTIVCSIGKQELVKPLLTVLDRKVKEANGDIVIAIHNHGPGDRVFPTTRAVYEQVKDLDPRIGFCADIGHTVRLGGDPLDELRVAPERLYDIHFKDVTSATAEGKSCVVGEGVMDIPKILRTLVELGYDRRISFEYEENAKAPFPHVTRSIARTREMIDSLA
ncbi:MAG: sugar phosphate isomerase/epimerase family protein [Thermoguttaceae bacterium]